MFKRVVVMVLFCLCMACAFAQAWTIEDYQIVMKLDKDSTLMVTEVLDADFGYERKHGIFRDIPTTYNDEQGRPYNIRFDVVGVRDQDQRPWQYKEENHPHFKRIKIGSPSRTVSGTQTYVITYRVTGAVLFLENHDELFWNAVGLQWDVKIDRVHVSLYLPQPISKELIKTAAYTGVGGSKTSNALIKILSGDHITFEGGNYLPHEGFTIVVGVPKGILTPPPAPASARYSQPVAREESSYSVFDMDGQSSVGPGALILPTIVFSIVWGIWQLFGRDPELNKSIVVEYKAPEGLKPAEIGTLIDHRVDQRDITSTIIDLAIRGYLKIVQQKGLFWEKEYALLRLKPFEDDGSLKSYEKAIMRGIFGSTESSSAVKLSELRNKFYQQVRGIENKVKDELGSRKFLRNERNAIVVTYVLIGGIVLFIGIMMCVYDLWLMIALIFSGIIIFLFGVIMPTRTIEGTAVLSKILGFKEFLQRTEKDKIQKAEQQDIFERMLPYAICLGISTKWAKKFDGLYAQPPQWFTGDYGNVFVYERFIHDLDHSINSMGSTFYSSPQTVSSSGGFSGGGFSGGGSSGGGFGGGGGGSW